MRVLQGVVAILILAVLGLAGWVYSGGYDASATAKNPMPVEWITETARRQSVRIHSRDIQVPQLADSILVEEGARTFAANCTQCHVAPGAEPPRIAAAMQPSPPDLAKAVRQWTTPELFWIVRNGFKMTGMPAWGQIMVDGEIWAVVAFLEQLTTMAPERYRQMVAPPAQPPAPPLAEEQVIPPSDGEEPAETPPEPKP